MTDFACNFRQVAGKKSGARVFVGEGGAGDSRGGQVGLGDEKPKPPEI